MSGTHDRELLVEARVNDQRDLTFYGMHHYGTYEPQVRQVATCAFCSERFVPHPGFADHQDKCDLNPLNRPHIFGTATAVLGSHDTER